MKIECKRDELLAAYQIVSTVVPTRSPKAILQNVRLDVAEQNTILMATDMEVGIRAEVSGIEVTAPGSVVLPVSRFGPILRESVDEKLQIESDGQGVTITGQRSRFNLQEENPDEYPTVAAFEETQYHQLQAKLMRELVRRTLYATDTESSRYALGGVLLEFEPDRIVSVGTDGRRLAKMEGPVREEGGHRVAETMTIVPARAMQLIERVVSEADAEIQIAARTNDVLLRAPRAVVYSRLVEGRFPRWRDVFPSRTDAIRLDLKVGPVYAAIRQAAVVTSDDSRGVDFTFSEGTLVLSGSTAEVGQSRVEMPISYEGDEIKVTLDHRFVSDFCKVLDLESSFTLEIQDREGAAVFSTDDGYAYVVMPLSKEQKR